MPSTETYQRLKKQLKKKKTWLKIGARTRDHLLTLAYSIGNSALYLNSANQAFKLLGWMEKDIDEDNPLFYANTVATLVLFFATYRSYLRSNHEYFTKELPNCRQTCSVAKGIKTSAGTIGSVFKAVAASGSLFALVSRVIGDSATTYSITGVISLGNLVANLSILNRPEKRFLEGEFEEDSHLLTESSRRGELDNSVNHFERTSVLDV